jgi:hypothetical protein
LRSLARRSTSSSEDHSLLPPPPPFSSSASGLVLVVMMPAVNRLSDVGVCQRLQRRGIQGVAIDAK